MSAGIINKMKFVSPVGKDYKKFIDYIDREETKAYISIKDFDKYTDYMGNPDKSTGVFNNEKDNLDKKDLKKIKEQFLNAQNDSSPLWQIVYSFDNDFLRENNLLSPEGLLNEAKIREAIRKSVDTIKDKEKMNDSLIWTGAIHYNTDNIHIHVAMAEEISSRPFQSFQNKNGKEFTARKGKFEKGTLWSAKSTFANSMIDKTQELTHITNLMRKEINKSIKEVGIKKDNSIIKQCENLMDRLPDNMQLWKYNMNAMKEFRPEIDKISKQLMETYNPKALEELQKAIKKEADFRERMYGDTRSGREFSEGKMRDLYSMIGNGVLKEMRELKKDERYELYRKSKFNSHNRKENKNSSSYMAKAKVSFIRGLKQLSRKTKQEFLTQLKIDREEFMKKLEKEREEQQRTYELERGL